MTPRVISVALTANVVPTAVVPLTAFTMDPLTVSVTASMIPPVPLMTPTMPSLTPCVGPD